MTEPAPALDSTLDSALDLVLGPDSDPDPDYNIDIDHGYDMNSKSRPESDFEHESASIDSLNLALFQEVVTSYYHLLVADFERMTTCHALGQAPMRPPKKHRNPPEITLWTREQLGKVLENYTNFTKTKRYLKVRHESIRDMETKMIADAQQLLLYPSELQTEYQLWNSLKAFWDKQNFVTFT